MHSQLRLTTAPTSEPVTVSDLKSHLRIDHADEDALVLAVAAAARSKAETFLKKSLMPTVWTWALSGFPASLLLPVGPVVTTDGLAISYIDDLGNSQTLSASNFQVSLGDYCRIAPAYGYTWPSTRAQLEAATVTFKAGYASADAIPPAILQAIRLIAGDLYRFRENSSEIAAREVPTSAANLMTPFIRH